MKKIIVTACAVLLMAGSARADGMAAAFKLGTLGPGVDLTGYLLPQLNVRANVNYASFGFTGDSGDVDYDMDMDFLTVFGLLDWHPYENNFRISAGVGLNNNKFDLKGKNLDSSTTIGDHEYSAAQIGNLNGSVTFDDFAPYFGIGFGNPVADDVDWTFSFDLGIMIQGVGDVDLTADGTASDDAQFQNDLQQEEDDAQDIADDFEIYPVVSFGIAYYFW
jgi:hypothetical protein